MSHTITEICQLESLFGKDWTKWQEFVKNGTTSRLVNKTILLWKEYMYKRNAKKRYARMRYNVATGELSFTAEYFQSELPENMAPPPLEEFEFEDDKKDIKPIICVASAKKVKKEDPATN